MQEQLMQKDTCLVVDSNDCITGHGSKHDCHRFVGHQPTGMLHRAFSVFLFNTDNHLLLQQRAASKITFPNVWTNTCCSHPLYGQEDNEVDSPDSVADGTVLGVKRAAVRKLHHELGIPREALPLSSFKYLTRLHYCAADVVTWGPNAEWGEHEIDYILFVRADVQISPNPDEVQAVKYVSFEELTKMMSPSSELLWSPWFKIIAENFLGGWWKDLNETLTTDKHINHAVIHKIL